MAAPAGWDEKSWHDVMQAVEQLSKLLPALSAAVLVEDADANHLMSLLADVERVGGAGAMAASWCLND